MQAKTGDKRGSPAELAGEYETVSVVFPFGGHPWGQHRMDGDRWRRARAQRRRRFFQYTILCFKCKACRFLCFLWDASHQETRSPLGVSFCCQKETKDHLGRSPLRTSLGVRGWACIKSKFGPLPLLWLLLLPPYQAILASWPYGWGFPRPGLPWRSGVPAAGSQASGSWEQRLTRVRPWQSKYNVPEKQARSVEFPCHLCDPTGPRAETRRTQGHPVPRGGFHKAGEGPAFGDSFPSFSSLRKGAQRSVPGWGAGFRRGNRRTASPAERPRLGRWFPPGKSENGKPSGALPAGASEE